MNITILSTELTTQPNTRGGTYQQLNLAYKNNTFQGKVEGKKLMSFGGSKAAFDVLSVAQQGDSYEITTFKNDKGYLDWTAAVKSGMVQGTTTTAPAEAPKKYETKGNWETPQERDKRQTSIIRQSSLGHAVATLSVGSKSVDPMKVIEVAKQYEIYVHSAENFAAGATGFDDVPSFDVNFTPE